MNISSIRRIVAFCVGGAAAVTITSGLILYVIRGGSDGSISISSSTEPEDWRRLNSGDDAWSSALEEIRTTVLGQLVELGFEAGISERIASTVGVWVEATVDSDFDRYQEHMRRSGLEIGPFARGVIEKWGPEMDPEMPWTSLSDREGLDRLFQAQAARKAEIAAIDVGRITVGRGVLIPYEVHQSQSRGQMTLFTSAAQIDMSRRIPDAGTSVDGAWIMFPVRFADGDRMRLHLTFLVDGASGDWAPYRLEWIGGRDRARRMMF